MSCAYLLICRNRSRIRLSPVWKLGFESCLHLWSSCSLLQWLPMLTSLTLLITGISQKLTNTMMTRWTIKSIPSTRIATTAATAIALQVLRYCHCTPVSRCWNKQLRSIWSMSSALCLNLFTHSTALLSSNKFSFLFISRHYYSQTLFCADVARNDVYWIRRVCHALWFWGFVCYFVGTTPVCLLAYGRLDPGT